MPSKRSSRSFYRNPGADMRTAIYLSDAAKSRRLLLRGPNRPSSVLATPVRLQPVDKDDLIRAMKLHKKRGYLLYEDFAGERRPFIGLAKRAEALARLQRIRTRTFRSQLSALRSNKAKLERRKSLKSFNAIEDLQTAIPALTAAARLTVDMLVLQREHLEQRLSVTKLSASLLGNQEKEIEKISYSLEKNKNELSVWKQRVVNLEGAGNDINVYRRYRNQSKRNWNRFKGHTSRIEQLRQKDKVNPETITKWLIAGFNFYAREIDRLTYELKILHKLGIAFVGRNEKRILSDLQYSRSKKAEFKRKI